MYKWVPVRVEVDIVYKKGTGAPGSWERWKGFSLAQWTGHECKEHWGVIIIIVTQHLYDALYMWEHSKALVWKEEKTQVYEKACWKIYVLRCRWKSEMCVSLNQSRLAIQEKALFPWLAKWVRGSKNPLPDVFRPSLTDRGCSMFRWYIGPGQNREVSWKWSAPCKN